MTKSPLADLLGHRITLCKRTRSENPEGDPTESWAPVVCVWAHIRVKSESPAGEEKQRVEVIMRGTRYRFQGMEWQGRLYQRQGRGIEDKDRVIWLGQEIRGKK